MSHQEFEAWWAGRGQFCRAGGGHYEKSFAWAAWKQKDDELEKRKDDLVELGLLGLKHGWGKQPDKHLAEFLDDKLANLPPPLIDPVSVAPVNGWFDATTTPPKANTIVIVAFEMDRPGDWRMKCGCYEPDSTDPCIKAQKGWRIFGGGWTPSHWTPLPLPPFERTK